MRSALVLILLAAGLAGCNRHSEKTASKGQAPTQAARDTARKALYPESDAVGIMRALDTAEIAVSSVARAATENDDVRRFAEVMIKDHRDIMHLIDSLGVAARENAISAKIRSAADSIAHGLGNIAVGLNNTYIEEEVKAHQQALQLMDTAIIPSATTPQLKTLLTQLRPTLLAHYQRAVQLLELRHQEAEQRHEAWISGLNVAPPKPKPVDSNGVKLLGVPKDTMPKTTTE